MIIPHPSNPLVTLLAVRLLNSTVRRIFPFSFTYSRNAFQPVTSMAFALGTSRGVNYISTIMSILELEPVSASV